MQKNAKNGMFFYKECKRTQRMERSFVKNGCPTLEIISDIENRQPNKKMNNISSDYWQSFTSIQLKPDPIWGGKMLFSDLAEIKAES